MAAYASTVISLMRKAAKIDEVTGIYIFAGKCDVTNYNVTLAEITDITGQFKSIISVMGGISDNGHLMQWDKTAGAFKAYKPLGAHTHTENTAASYVQNATTAASVAEAAEEATTDVDVGEVEFIAIGLR